MELRSRTVLVLLALALSAALFLSTAISCSRQPRYPVPPISDGQIAINIASLPQDVPQFFTYVHKGKHISFFVISLNTGVQSFFDACVTCFPKKLGYASEDGRVVCRACNTSYSIYKLDKGIGGCYPIQIKGRTKGGMYIIPLDAITAEAGKF
jgi:uncharacterized membrane protein